MCLSCTCYLPLSLWTASSAQCNTTEVPRRPGADSISCELHKQRAVLVLKPRKHNLCGIMCQRPAQDSPMRHHRRPPSFWPGFVHALDQSSHILRCHSKHYMSGFERVSILFKLVVCGLRNLQRRPPTSPPRSGERKQAPQAREELLHERAHEECGVRTKTHAFAPPTHAYQGFTKFTYECTGYTASLRFPPPGVCGRSLSLVLPNTLTRLRPNAALPAPNPPAQAPTMSWIEGLPHQRTPDLVGQKIKVWWNDDQGKQQPGLGIRGGEVNQSSLPALVNMCPCA